MTHQLVRQNFLDYIILFVVSIIWGSAFGAIKLAVVETGPLSLVASRTLLGFLAMAVFLFFAGGWRVDLRTMPYRRLLAIGFIGTAIPFFLIAWAEQYVDSTVAGLLNGASPLVTVIGAHFVTKDELMTRGRFIGVLVGLIGAVLLMHEGFAQMGHSSLWAQFGLILAFGCYGAGNLLVRGQTALRPSQLACFSLLLTSIFFVPAAILIERPNITTWSFEAWLALLWLGVVSTAMAFSLRYILINRAGAGFLSNVGYLIPMIAVLIGYFILDETISNIKIIAMAIIILSLYITRIAGIKLRVRGTK